MLPSWFWELQIEKKSGTDCGQVKPKKVPFPSTSFTVSVRHTPFWWLLYKPGSASKASFMTLRGDCSPIQFYYPSFKMS